jgi:uncharacterized membrane protein YidH (DUF202 family)
LALAVPLSRFTPRVGGGSAFFVRLTRAMKKTVPYEAIAAIMMIFGAFLLVAVYFPVINPGQYRLESHQEAVPLSRYIIGTPISLLILGGAWHFNRKAQRMKRDEKDAEHDHKPSA